MSDLNVTASAGGLSFFTILGIVFITLKLTHYVDWSWWWVLLPIYGPWMVTLFLVVLLVSIFGGN